MPLRRRTTIALTLAASFVGMPSALAQSADLRFGNPTRFMPQSGEALYAAVCQGCHMPGGVGAVGAGAYPALTNNPRLAVAGHALAMVIKGRKGMPPFGGLLNDQQVAAVVNYVRTHFGNDFRDEVTATDAQALR